MKINACDVCFYERDGKPLPRDGVKTVMATRKISHKDGKGTRISLDVCNAHADFFEKGNSFAENSAKLDKLYNI